MRLEKKGADALKKPRKKVAFEALINRRLDQTAVKRSATDEPRVNQACHDGPLEILRFI